jgi:aryl-alcohol dehydrogenase-like predicted oxidoreductase
VPDDVARLVLGTAALGLPYGLAAADGAPPRLLPEAEAHALVRAAFDAGIDTFDTAPAYGEAEARLGRALAGAGHIWTKVGADAVRSVEASLERLQRRRLTLVSWHNWTRALGDDPRFRECWNALRGVPSIDALGATTYGADDAAAAVTSGFFDVVQVEWNLLRQAVLARVRETPPKNVRLAVRSVWLQGVLTPRGRTLPTHLRALTSSVTRAQQMAREWGLELEALALRAALDQPGVDRVVIGVDSAEGLASALKAARRSPLTSDQRAALSALDRGDDPLTDPRTWA